jgi:hypothetical protein
MSLESIGGAKKKPAFTPEGVLNRNFGKDISEPSEAQFYGDGILNRPKFQESLRAQRQEEAVQEGVESDTLSLEDPTESEVGAIAQPESLAEESPAIVGGKEGKKSVYAELVAQYQSESDPEQAAFNALYERLEPAMSTEEKLAAMRKLVNE